MSTLEVEARTAPASPAQQDAGQFGAGPDSSSPAYPRARIPVVPVLSLASINHEGSGAPIRSVLDAPEQRFVTSGRVAIALALRQMGIGPGDKVLVPSYHCASMIEPVIWSGATPVFYRIHLDTSVDLDDIQGKLDGAVKLLMVTNYFGFHQPLAQIRAFCDARAIQLLEDCAHSFLGEHQGRSIGSWGDYAIASSMKFFPIYEGGCLVSARHSLKDVALHSAGLAFEAKVAINTLEAGFEYKRLAGVRALMRLPIALKNFLWGQIKSRKGGVAAPSLSPGSSDGGFGFDPAWMDKRSSVFSRLLLKLVSRRRMGEARRRNYRKLEQALSGLPGCRPLFPSLPDGVYPWVFPLLTEQPEPVFSVLKHACVPVVRFGEFLWPGVDASVCAASVALSRRVLQFPVHQELREQELEWMIEQIRATLLARGAVQA